MQAEKYFHQGAKRQFQKLTSSRKYKEKPISKMLRRKRKVQDVSVSSSKKAKRSYGGQLDDSDEVDSEQLKALCDTFVKTNISKSNEETEKVQETTKDQSMSETWKIVRRKRYSSSSFGKIIKRKINNKSTAIVKDIIY